MLGSVSRCLLFLCLACFGLTAVAQSRTTVPVRTLPPGLGEVTRRAGLIFAGRVVKIEPVRVADADHVASVRITLQVEQGVRGARAGQTLAFREWAGLWTGEERYRLGQRLMLFLYAPSSLGLTSPVGGAAGKFALDRDGKIVLTEAQLQAIRISPNPLRINIGRRIPLRDFSRAIRRMRGEE